MKIRSALITVFVLMSFTVCPAEEVPSDFRLATEKTVLDNGLTVLLSPMPSQPTVSIYALFKVGSALEDRYLGAGISHFIEHMLFKGTVKRGVGQISHEIQSLGGTINASTSFDYTIFTVTVPKEKFEAGLDILADMVVNPKFDPQEVEKERTVITKEIRLLRDQPQRVLSEAVFATVFQRHPYRIPIIGYEDIFLTLTRDDLVDFYSRYYIPNNMILSVAGDIQPQAVLPSIEQAFKDFRRGRALLRNLPNEPDPITQRKRTIEYPTPLFRLSMSYPGVTITDKDMFALDVLALILGKGRSSRLYQDLVADKQWVQSVEVSDYTPIDKGVFEIECVLSEDNIDRVIQSVRQQIATIKQRNVSIDELAKARRQVLRQYVLEHQTSSDVAYQTALDEAFTGDAEFALTYMELIKEVTPEDIRRVAQQYLVDKHLSVVVLRPEGKEEDSRSQLAEAAVEQPFETFHLKNGLTLVLKPDRTIPWISMVAALQGGVAQEDPGLNGIAELTSRTWNKGTRSRSAEEIANETENRGVSLGGFSTHNTFGLSMQCLPQEIDTGLRLFMDVLQQPTFPAEEIYKAKKQMLADIQARQDSIFDYTFTNMREKLFPGHPYGRTTLGKTETVEKLTRDQAVAFYQDMLTADNLVVTVIGDFPPEFKQKLEKLFRRIRSRQVSLRQADLVPLKDAVTETIRMDKEQAMVLLSFQAVGYAHADRYGLEVLTALLGSSFQGRIFKEIRDEFGQAYTLGGALRPSWNEGLVFFYVITTPEYVFQVRDMLIEIIDSAALEPFDEKDIQTMKSYLIGRQQRGLQTNSALAFRATLDTLQGLGPEYYRGYAEGIQSVTQAQIEDLSRKYLDLSRAVLVVTNPPDELVSTGINQ